MKRVGKKPSKPRKSSKPRKIRELKVTPVKKQLFVRVPNNFETVSKRVVVWAK